MSSFKHSLCPPSAASTSAGFPSFCGWRKGKTRKGRGGSWKKEKRGGEEREAERGEKKGKRKGGRGREDRNEKEEKGGEEDSHTIYLHLETHKTTNMQCALDYTNYNTLCASWTLFTLESLQVLWHLDLLPFPVTFLAACQTLLHTPHTGLEDRNHPGNSKGRRGSEWRRGGE